MAWCQSSGPGCVLTGYPANGIVTKNDDGMIRTAREPMTIAQLKRSTDRRFERLDRSLNRRFAKIDRRFDEMDRRFDELRRHFDIIAESLRDDFRLFADAIASHLERLDRHDQRITRLEGAR